MSVAGSRITMALTFAEASDVREKAHGFWAFLVVVCVMMRRRRICRLSIQKVFLVLVFGVKDSIACNAKLRLDRWTKSSFLRRCSDGFVMAHSSEICTSSLDCSVRYRKSGTLSQVAQTLARLAARDRCLVQSRWPVWGSEEA